jgi:DNA-binding response OmpR family regulator
LFLDDEEALTRVATRAMPACGCDAVAFSDPLEALEAFLTAPDSFDAVITDLTMPTMSGFDFIREVREVRPSVAVVLTSGFLTRQTEDEARRQRVGCVVPKPWSVDELASKTLALVHRSGGRGVS